MKSLFVMVGLALIPALGAAQPAPALAPTTAPTAAAPAVEGKDKLLAEIETWRNIQLPHVTPADQTTVRYEPRLDDIKSRAKDAKTAKDLARPSQEFQEWKTSLLHDKYATAQARRLTSGTFEQFSSEQNLQASFSSALSQQVALASTNRVFLSAQQQSASAFQAPATFFDGSGAHFSAGASVAPAVSAGAPMDSKDPARYAKVRSILISQGASSKVVDMAIKEAMRQNADPLLVLAVIKQESGFNPHARSGVGARGLMQIMPDTGRGLGVRNSSSLYDVQTNLRAGIMYLKQLWTRFTSIDMTAIGSINPFSSHEAKSAVAAYNAGPGAVHKYGGVPPYRETQGYVQKVLGYYQQMKQSLLGA
ncbi:MAG: lytic transglycosylase domain-containing protein [Elusimicrobiota bacterium]